MTEPPSPLTMLFSRHTRRREFITLSAAWRRPFRCLRPAPQRMLSSRRGPELVCYTAP